MPALLERPKLSNAMARALHKHIMKERERKRQEEEEVDKMMEQKMKEEEERKRTKEIEERMSLEETKEQVQKMGEKLQVLQEEKHQLFLQLKKVLHEEERRRRKEQSDITSLPSSSYQSSLPLHSGQHLLNIQGSPVGHNRAGGLLGERSKQLFQTPLMPGHQFSSQTGFLTGSSEHGQFTGSAAVHEPFAVTQAQHHTSYGHATSVPISFAGTTQIRGTPFQSMPFLSHQPQGYAVHSHFTAQSGFIPSASIPLQKQLEHANQQSGFTDSAALRPMHSQALHVSAAGLMSTPSMAVQISTAKAPFPSSSQPASRLAFVPHAQAGQRFFHHGKPH
ncbi:G protein pathway suppressor 2-like [Pimephales promelas]|uniref:G protein pathway suppressor 2-like n=1 Tax=Pimephales promelas TaxID=90988 RepID=UPI001955F09D|nr:G protein pathway suppressor 2-like [Pimephales promelas]KAG1952193.1 G protein pathway suppressor [Pimephales promelas]